MSETMAILGTAVLPEVLLKGAVVLLTAALLARTLAGASAATRHSTWAVALTVLLLLPLGIRMAPHWGLPGGAASEGAGIPMVLETTDRAMRAHAGSLPAESVGADRTFVPAAPATFGNGMTAGGAMDGSAAAGSEVDWVQRAGALAFVVWSLGFVLLLLRSARDLFRIRMITHYGSRSTAEPLARAAAEVRQSLGIRRRIAARVSQWTEVPVTWGVRRPVVLLPRSAENWSGDRLRAALVHEMAHIRRLDYAWHVLCEVAAAFHWPNPLVWWARRRMCEEQERACDDVVLRDGTRATDYADQLISIARDISRPALNATTAMARGPRISGRLEDILNRTLDRSPLSRPKALGRGLALLVASLVTAGATMHDRLDAPSDLADLFSLSANRSPAAMDVLLSQAGSPAAEVRGVAALTLGERRDPSAIPPLIAMLEDPDPWVRENVAVSLSRLGGPGTAEAVGRLLADSMASVRSVATWALGEIGGPLAVDLLTATLAEDSDEHTRVMAAAAIANIDGVDAVPGILARLENAPPDRRIPLISALDYLRDARSSPTLERLIRWDPDPEVRHAAVAAISPDDPQRVAIWTRAAREDEAWRVRNMAVVRLGEEHGQRSMDALMLALRDPVHQVRLNAAWALEGRGR